MCGLAGIVTRGQADAGDYARLRQMVDALAHRGPDASGTWTSDWLQLGHRRLSIIDLDESANQPFVDASTGTVVVFNGEIYNYIELRRELAGHGYQFTTASDTEVIGKAWHRWGPASLERLSGMWSIALYDTRTNSLILSRDRFGIKPLLWRREGECLAFASEPRALGRAFTPPLRADRTMIAEFLATGQAESGERTFFSNVRSLPPATFAVVTQSSLDITPTPYWSLAAEIKAVGGAPDYQEACRTVRTLLDESVALHLRSDVPVVTLLSGGIDSSALVGLSASLRSSERRPQHAYTVTLTSSTVDESPWARAVANRWGLEHRLFTATDAEFIENIDRAAYDQQEPFGSPGILLQWLVFKAIGADGFKVALDGQGADETFAGYVSFLRPFMQNGSRWQRLRRGISLLPTLASNARALLERFGSLGSIARGARRSLGDAPFERAVSGAWRDTVDSRARGQVANQPDIANEAGPLKSMLVDYVLRRSLPSLLRFEDRSSMAFSVESRVPFLDHRLVGFVLSLPETFLIRNGQTKAILRDATRDVVPRAVARRRLKLGFASPVREWTERILGKQGAVVAESPVLRELFGANAAASAADPARVHSNPGLHWRAYSVARWGHDLGVAVGDASPDRTLVAVN